MSLRNVSSLAVKTSDAVTWRSTNLNLSEISYFVLSCTFGECVSQGNNGSRKYHQIPSFFTHYYFYTVVKRLESLQTCRAAITA